MMTGIVPCLYNSFSFTSENIFGGDIVCYEIKNTRNKEPVVCIEPPSKAVLPEPLFSKNTNVHYDDCDEDNNEKFDVPCSDGSESDNTSENSSVSSSSSSASTSSSSSTSVHDASIQFNRDTMKQYAYTMSTDVTDTILWCAYIMLYNIEKFETVENHYVESNRFKFELIELFRQNKPKLKANKLKLSSVEESLVHKPFITLETLHAIAICNSISLCIVQDRKFYEISNGDIVGSGSPGLFIIEKIKGKFVLYIAPKQKISEYLVYIRKNYWHMESISAPIRPMSAYKLQDLVDISQKLNLPIVNVTPGKFGSMPTEKRKTKPELYEAICRCL
jgi:hypothetical protein